MLQVGKPEMYAQLPRSLPANGEEVPVSPQPSGEKLILMAVLLLSITREPEGRGSSPGSGHRGGEATREGSRAWHELSALLEAANPIHVQQGPQVQSQGGLETDLCTQSRVNGPVCPGCEHLQEEGVTRKRKLRGGRDP